MFKSWRNEKKKIKMVFKLQFQATQVPKLKKPGLFVSLMPEDVGKPTFKLEKTAVKEGICTWEKPVFVTVKLVKEMKTGKLHEKIYHFIVSSGSSKSGYLGEASIDFADFAEEAGPMTVSLPLKFANSGAVLNVTIQKMQEGTDQRYIQENGESKTSNDVSLKRQMENEHTDCNGESFAEDRSLENEEEGSLRSNMGSNAITPKNRLHRRSSTEWSLGSASDGSLFESINSLEDNPPRESQDASSDNVEKLKTEISNLMRQVDLSDLEMQSLRKQVMKENRRAQDLSIQVADLKVEKDALKMECENLKSSQKSTNGEELLKQLLAENEDLRVKVEEIRRELSHEKDVKTNLQLQLEKTQDSNAELVLAVQDLDELLERKDVEISRLSSKLELTNDKQELDKMCKCNVKENREQLAVSALEKVDGEENDRNELHQLQQKISDLCDEIEMYREDREKMESYMERLTQEYEDLKEENHVVSSKLEQTQVEELRRQHESSESAAKITELESELQRLEGKFKKQTHELSESVISINELDSQVKWLQKELEKQAKGFENDMDAMKNAKIEQEQRAIRAERLEEEFKRLSVEMTGKFEENEKLTTKAMAETEELHLQNKSLEDKLQKAAEELALIKDQNKIRVEELSTHLDFKTKHIEQMSLELEEMSNRLRDVTKREEDKQDAIKMLKARIEKLNEESNHEHSKQDGELRNQLEQMMISLAETRNLLETSKREKDELQRKFELEKKETVKTQDELCTLRSLKEEKETTIKELLSEMEKLRTQHKELRHCLSSEELQKETLQKQILQLKDELQKVQDTRKFEERKTVKDLPHSKRTTIKNKLAKKEDSTAILERNESDLTELLEEMALLKERNKSMEKELKEMEERYSEISLKFAMVEGERQELVMTVRNLRNGKKN